MQVSSIGLMPGLLAGFLPHWSQASASTGIVDGRQRDELDAVRVGVFWCACRRRWTLHSPTAAGLSTSLCLALGTLTDALGLAEPGPHALVCSLE